MAKTSTGWGPFGTRVDAGRMRDLEAQIAAIQKSNTVVEFDLDGTLRTANENFLNAMGYRLDEIQGKPHSLFVDSSSRDGNDERAFWQKLARGEFVRGQFKRLGKGGKVVWLEASYDPILDAGGKPSKIVNYGSDVTASVSHAQETQRGVAQAQDIVRAAVAGDLSKRIDTSTSSGDGLKMADAVNELLGVVSEAFGEVNRVITKAAEGDLTGRVPIAGRSGELRATAESVNLLMESVSNIVSNVNSAAGEVLRGAEEISQGNIDLSQRTEQQSASLEETASSMEEMTSTVKQNADNAAQANQLAKAARDQAEKGGSVVSNAVSAMAKINEASSRIASIISVIEEIAFQTNLLALNAAVEAARAGEQGRGFAVVASEVRSLAGRSATAAKEIKDLIQDSVQKVEDGSKLVTQSGQTLDQIVTSVKKVSDIVAEIAAASREQSSGIEQVNKAVMEMDETTQQNAALVEQATAASQSMAEQARQLTTLMEHYKGVDAAPAFARSATPRKAKPAMAPTSERRAGSRPWAAKSAPRAKQSAARPPARPPAQPQSSGDAGAQAPAPARASPAAANTTDADWVEF
jgi:methyl-accepting chemotaxis protein